MSPAAASEQLPMLASACPGWVCYAEKTQTSVLPNISTTKSPQVRLSLASRHYRSSHDQHAMETDRLQHKAK